MTAVQERSTRAMGTTARVTVVGSDAATADAVLRRLDDLEARWSRFRETSELSRMNASAGSPCIVSADTFTLVEHLVGAWYDTAGRFDPSVHDALVHLGYATSLPFDDPSCRGVEAGLHALQPDATPGCSGVRLDRALRMVWLPDGVHLDPGGLGKGLAADMLAEEAMAAGAAGVLIDLGGDVRVVGDPPEGDAWQIAVEHPGAPHRTIARVATRDGGIATTSRRRRRWTLSDGNEAHHVLDPRTAHPAGSRWTSATAIAARAVDAEVGATVAFLDGNIAGAPRLVGALLADVDGATKVLGDHPELFALAVGSA